MMTIYAYLKIDTSLLSTSKTNVIPFTMGDNPTVLGSVAEIHEQVMPGQYRCLIKVSPEHELTVALAMKAEEDKLKGE